MTSDQDSEVADLLEKAIAFDRNSDSREALIYYRRCLGKAPSNVLQIIANRILEITEEMGDLRDTELLISDLLENHGDQPLVQQIIGEIFLSRKNHPDAALHLHEAWLLDGTNPEIRASLGRCLSEWGLAPTKTKLHLAPETRSDDMFTPHWNLHDHYRSWLDVLEQAQQCPGTTKSPQIITVIAIYPWWISLTLAMAVVLSWMGHKINFLWMPTLGQIHREADWETELITRELRLLQEETRNDRINFISLLEFEPSKLPFEVHEWVSQQVKYDTMNQGQAPIVDMANEMTADLYALRHDRNFEISQRFQTFVENSNYHTDTWITQNGRSLEWGALRKQIQTCGGRTVNIEYAVRKNRIILSVNKTCADFDPQDAWKQEYPHRVDQARRSRIAEWMQETETPEYFASEHFMQQFQREQKKPKSVIFDQLSLDANRPIIVVFPNVIFDMSVLLPNVHTIFEGVVDWLTYLIDLAHEHRSAQIIVRPHPSEFIFGLKYTLQEALLKLRPRLPDNVTYLPNSTAINSYGLIDIADLGLTYVSDIGWEMVLRGVPVICGGHGHFTHKGFTNDPESKEDFSSMFRTFLEQPESRHVTERQRELAIVYADMFLNKIQRNFPWRWAHLWENLESYPMKKMLTQNGWGEFGQLFQILSGDITAYDGLIGEIPNP